MKIGIVLSKSRCFHLFWVLFMKIRRAGIMVLDWFSNLPSLQYISPPPCSCSEHLHYSLGWVKCQNVYHHFQLVYFRILSDEISPPIYNWEFWVTDEASHNLWEYMFIIWYVLSDIRVGGLESLIIQ